MPHGDAGTRPGSVLPLKTLAPRAPLLLGDEAVALAALHAGISAAYAYPGTPSTEIFEYLEPRAARRCVTAHWCANEKTAYEQALGVSMAGGRALVSMKHVGLNVAMDPFVNSALVGIRGGLVVVAADDPGMHSSQNEQDSRILADFAGIPCLEPGSQQEAYDMTREAFSWSERHRVPVMVRMVTRICHGRAEIVEAEPAPEGRRAPSKPVDAWEWTLLPGNARRLRKILLASQEGMRRDAAASAWNGLDPGDPSARRGVVTTGIARNYLRENLDELAGAPPHLHIGAYPAPHELFARLAERADEILVLEEGEPFLERRLRGLLPGSLRVLGKESGELPMTGELTPEDVRSALGLPARRGVASGLAIPGRPPQLCGGCPHRDAFQALQVALEGLDRPVVAGDIGCYALGALEPFQALESCVSMGASIGMAKGASDAGLRPALAVIGDSTFLHSGITPLLDAAAHDTDMTVLILDNGTVGMTGQQPTAAPRSAIEAVVRGAGVSEGHVHLVELHPKRVGAVAEVIRREVAHPGLSVIIAVRECVEAARKHKADERERDGGGAT